MMLCRLGEFGFIDRVTGLFPRHFPESGVGIGDDCAVIPLHDKKVLLVTTDSLIEDVHFLLSAIPAEDLGYKSLAVNLSDIAAMGGKPHQAFLSLGVGKDTRISLLDGFLRGFRELCEETEVELLGGDTTGTPGPLIINVTILGTMRSDNVKLRSHAKPGDLVCVTDFIGDSGGGLSLLLKGLPTEDRDNARLIQRHHRPRPHLEEGSWLARQEGVHAMMDVSDGIDSDTRRIADRSQCGVDITLDTLPLSPTLLRVSERYGWNPKEIGAAGGEDYCLLVTLDSEKADEIRRGFHAEFQRPLHLIGSITESRGIIRYLTKEGEANLTQHGFDHFKGGPQP